MNMLSEMKKQVMQIQHQPSGQKTAPGELSIALYHEKCVQEHLTKLLAAKKEASKAWLSWAETEENLVAKGLFTRITELEGFMSQAYTEYYQEYENYRGYFKQIIKGEKQVDDAKKVMDDYSPKIKKTQKQIDSLNSSSKGVDKKLESLSSDLGRFLSLHKQAEKAYQTTRDNHNMFKMKSIREAVQSATAAQTKLHSRCFEIFQTQLLLLDYYTATTYSRMTDDVFKDAIRNGDLLIQELLKKLNLRELPPRLSCLPSALDESNLAIDDTYNPIPEYNDEEIHRVDDTYEDTSQYSYTINTAVSLIGRNNSGRRPLPSIPATDDTNAEYNDLSEFSSMPQALYLQPTALPPNISPLANRPTVPPPTQKTFLRSQISLPADVNAPPPPPRKRMSAMYANSGSNEEGHAYLMMEKSSQGGTRPVSSYPTNNQRLYPQLPHSRDSSIKSTSSHDSGRNDSGVGGSGTDDDVFGTCSQFATNSQSKDDEYELWNS